LIRPINGFLKEARVKNISILEKGKWQNDTMSLIYLKRNPAGTSLNKEQDGI
jgi:hypothetical protein